MKAIKRIIAVVAAVAAIATFAACGKKADDLETVRKNGKLVVGITEFAPMDYRDADKNWIGFDADAASAFAAYLGVEVEFSLIDWDRKTFELEAGTIDCVWNGMTLTGEVTESMSCSNAYCNNTQVVVVPADKAADYQSADACKSRKNDRELDVRKTAYADCNDKRRHTSTDIRAVTYRYRLSQRHKSAVDKAHRHDDYRRGTLYDRRRHRSYAHSDKLLIRYFGKHSLDFVTGNHFKAVAHQLHSVQEDADTAKQGQKRIKYVKPIHFNFGWTKFARFSPL